MIKKFISNGILGIPDMELELEDEKIIIIKGDNGSGKSSLLKQITHPFSSHTKFNRLLKPGIDDGYTIMYINYNGRDYKIQHLYSRTKKSVSVLSYLSKYDNSTGKWVELVENGLPTTFKEVCNIEMNYEQYMYDILNIGVENKGIIDFTSTERIEYLKKILKLEVLNEIKKNVLDNLSNLNASYKFLQNKLSEYKPLPDMVNEIKELKSNILNLNNKLDYNKTELAKINIIDNLSELNDKKKDILDNLADLNQIYKILANTEYNLSYEDIIADIKEDISNAKNNISNMDNSMLQINEQLLSIKDIDNKKLLDEKKELENLIKEIDNKYKANKFNDIELSDLALLKDSITNVEFYIRNSQVGLSKIQSLYKKYDDINLYKTEHELKIKDTNSKIAEIVAKLNEIDLSGTLTAMEVPNACNVPKCALKVELERQLKNLDIDKVLKQENNRLSEYLVTLEEEYFDVKEIVKTINGIRNIYNNIDKNNLAIFFKDDFYKIINNDNISALLEDIINHDFYFKEMKDKDMYLNRLYSINELLDIENKGNNDRKRYLVEELNKYTKSINEEKEILLAKNNELAKLKININNHNNSFIKKDNMINAINNYKNDLSLIDDKINDIKNKENVKMKINNEIEDINNKIKYTNDRYYTLKNDIKELNKIDKDFSEISIDLQNVKILKEIVSSRLPARTMEGYLYDIANTVNTLLHEFMTIRFDVSDGIDIIVNRQGTERLATDLSQGEKSMLAIAMLMAFKKSITWKIISLDEIDATLDEENKSKFIYLIRDYSETIENLSQIFIVTHTDFNDNGMDVKIINL